MLILCDPMDCPWNSPGQNTGVGSLSLLQGIFLTQGSNRGLLHCRRIICQLSYQGSPKSQRPPPKVIKLFSVSSVQSLSCVQLFATPWTAAHQSSQSITNCQSLLKLMSIESVMPSHHLILCHPLLLLHSIFPSIRVFSKEPVLRIRWPKYWSFSFSISLSNEYSVLISFRMDWFDLLAVQETLKSFLQHHSSKAQILRCSAFFMVQFTSIHDYWKNHSFDLYLCWQSNVSAF